MGGGWWRRFSSDDTVRTWLVSKGWGVIVIALIKYTKNPFKTVNVSAVCHFVRQRGF